MSAIPTETSITIVDTVDNLLPLLDIAFDPADGRPSLYVDLDGIQLGRHGSISIVSLYVLPRNEIYLIDVHLLGSIAFSTRNSNGISLKTVLESPTIPKVVFDIRNNSDALYSHFGISVDGIRDLQLMELGCREGSQKFVAGLARCIEIDSSLPAAAKATWQCTKKTVRQLFSPERGGRYEVFNERPMRPIIIQYCAGDVAVLPELYDIYNAELSEYSWVEVEEATNARITLSQRSWYDPQGGSKARGPWDSDFDTEDNLGELEGFDHEDDQEDDREDELPGRTTADQP